jgi:prevent-host-death family protein
MSGPITIRAAQARFSELIRRVEAGDEIVITRYGKPAAKLVRMAAVSKGKRCFGSLRGAGKFDESFWDQLPDDFLGPFKEQSPE